MPKNQSAVSDILEGAGYGGRWRCDNCGYSFFSSDEDPVCPNCDYEV
jgi:rubrerythrin